MTYESAIAHKCHRRSCSNRNAVCRHTQDVDNNLYCTYCAYKINRLHREDYPLGLIAPRYVGFSLSFCISDILDGKIPLERVAFIVPGFKWKGNVPENYFDAYWYPHSRKQVEEVLEKVTFHANHAHGGINIARGSWWPEDQFDWTVVSDASKRLHIGDLTL